MEYQDEKILELQKLKKKELYAALDTGIFIQGRVETFAAKTYFDGSVRIMVPESFVPMPEELARLKYASEQRPQVIESSLDGSVNLTMSYFAEKLKADEVERTKTVFKTAITVLNPANVFYDDVVRPLGKTQLSWFDYRGYALDDQLYNLMFVTSIEGRMLFGTFNCRFSDYGEWKPAAVQMIESIEDLTGGRIK